MDGRNSLSPAWSAAAAAQLYEGQTIEFSARNQTPKLGPPDWSFNRTERIASPRCFHVNRPSRLERRKDSSDSEIPEHANPRIQPACDAKKNRAHHNDRR
jgi:hypothetical protein